MGAKCRPTILRAVGIVTVILVRVTLCSPKNVVHDERPVLGGEKAVAIFRNVEPARAVGWGGGDVQRDARNIVGKPYFFLRLREKLVHAMSYVGRRG